jgi:spermidine synthase
MDIPIWKKWWSYVSPVTIESAGSDQNPNLAVVLDRGRLQLLSGQAIYSWDDLYHNFTKAFEVLRPEQQKFRDVLLLGLGLGSVPLILERKHGMRYAYTAVELDEVVADMASRYTLSRLESYVEIITTDASIFVELCEDQYDLVIVDVFEDNITPAVFESPEFLRDCLRLVRPGGWVLYNRLYQTSMDKLATERFWEQTFRLVMPQPMHIDTEGNWILVSRV